MKSLNKAFDIMEYVLSQDGLPVTPANVANDLGIPVATCVRSLETLVARGYVEKISRRTGYVAGPALFGLSAHNCPYSRLIKASMAPLKELAEKTSSLVNLSVMIAGRRYILNYHSAVARKISISKTVYYLDHYVTATGRVLMSTMPRKDVEAIVDEFGLPNDRWPEIKSREELFRALVQIKKENIISYKRGPHWVIGGLVYGESCPPAAIGFAIDENLDPTEALSHTATAIKQMEAELELKHDFC